MHHLRGRGGEGCSKANRFSPISGLAGGSEILKDDVMPFPPLPLCRLYGMHCMRCMHGPLAVSHLPHAQLLCHSVVPPPPLLHLHHSMRCMHGPLAVPHLPLAQLLCDSVVVLHSLRLSEHKERRVRLRPPGTAPSTTRPRLGARAHLGAGGGGFWLVLRPRNLAACRVEGGLAAPRQGCVAGPVIFVWSSRDSIGGVWRAACTSHDLKQTLVLDDAETAAR